jgi:uncharacterized protein (DUF362 family)
MISLIVDPTLTYPEANDFYSPDERFPEYRHAHVSERKNPIYRAVRQCFAQAGLDREHFATPSWNPLGSFVQSGSRVFVLCNFVLHREPAETAQGFAAKCIHGSVLRALVDYLLLAVGETGSIAFGNAPMQHCDWEAVLRDTGAQTVADFYRSIQAPVEAQDLRLFVIRRNRMGRVTRVERRHESDGVSVNLGTDSLMVELDRAPSTPYRVMNYSPTRLEAFHSGGNHMYVINRRILEADTVVSLPKLKTHEKVGITCVLKGFVGAVGHKDSLPHYRYGPPEIGGDEYPSDRAGLLRLALGFHYRVQRSMPESKWGNVLRVIDRFVRAAVTRRAPVTEGAWWGNDTAWRMVLDLARIVNYANHSGELQATPCRQHLALVDGVIGGEGEGPLEPDPVHSGVLMFSDGLAAADVACASMMGFEPQRMPVVREALHLSKYPLMRHGLSDEQVVYNGRSSSMSELGGLAPQRYNPPSGWQGKL